MKSNKGCDGGCVVDEDMYKKVMDTIKNQMFSQSTSDDCVSRADLLSQINKSWGTIETKLDFVNIVKALSPVTPIHGTCKDCKHWERIGYAIPSDGRCKHFDDVWRGNSILPLEHGTTENFYCADFKRRE